ncbi:MAG: hypothetical protein AAF628_23610 [Planctomycetota bacterium]
MLSLTDPIVRARRAGLTFVLGAGLAWSGTAQTPTLTIDEPNEFAYGFTLQYTGSLTPDVVGMVVGYVSVEPFDGTNPWAAVVSDTVPSLAPVSNTAGDFLAQINGTPVPGGSTTVGDEWDVQVTGSTYTMPGVVVGEALAPLASWNEAGQPLSSTNLVWDAGYWTTTPSTSILDWVALQMSGASTQFDRARLVRDLIRHRHEADTGLPIGDDTLNAILNAIDNGDADFFLDAAAIIVQQPGSGDPVVKISPLARLKIDLPEADATLRFPLSAPSRYLYAGAVGATISVELDSPRLSPDLEFAFAGAGGQIYVTADGHLGQKEISCIVPAGATAGPVIVLDHATYAPTSVPVALASPDGPAVGYFDFHMVTLGT